MAAVPLPPAHCDSSTEQPFRRMLRLAGTGLLTVQALVLASVALFGIMGSAGAYRWGNTFFLLTSLSLLVCTLWSFRDPQAATRWLFLPCLACFVALFFTGFAHEAEGFTITLATGTRYYSGALFLAGLILMAMVLSRFLRWFATRAACNCGL